MALFLSRSNRLLAPFVADKTALRGLRGLLVKASVAYVLAPAIFDIASLNVSISSTVV
jgi:hypothetical protein